MGKKFSEEDLYLYFEPAHVIIGNLEIIGIEKRKRWYYKCLCKCKEIIYIRIDKIHKEKPVSNCIKCSNSSELKTKSKSKYDSYKIVSGCFIASLIDGTRNRHGRKIYFNITAKDIYDQFEKQQGLCAKTGVRLTFPQKADECGYKKGKVDPKINYASVDRISSKIGYIKTNIRIIEMSFNRFINNYENEEFNKKVKAAYLWELEKQKDYKNMEVQYYCEHCQLNENCVEKCEYIREQYVKKTCIHCGQYSEIRKRCFESFNIPYAIIKNSPRTLGELAEANGKMMGRNEIAERREENKQRAQLGKELMYSEMERKLPAGASVVKPSEETPWFRDGTLPGIPKSDTPIDIKSISNIDKYIKEGVA